MLPTWQFHVDSTKVNANISFNESYNSGSSLSFEGFADAEIPSYKTKLSLDKALDLQVVMKTSGHMYMQIYCQLSNGETLTFPLKKSSSWFTNTISIPAHENIIISKIGLLTKGEGNTFLGELSIHSKKEKIPETSSFSVEKFVKDRTAELYIHFNEKSLGVYHNIYYLNAKNEKVWLGKTHSQDFYISNILIKKSIIYLEVKSESFGGMKGRILRKKVKLLQ